VAIKAYRSGETAAYWSADPYEETLNAGRPALQNVERPIIFFKFKMASEGGGVTDVLLEVSSESFESVAKTIVETNEDAAIRAFGAALLNKSQSASDSN
jgi:hypothetical protein